jgi:hypothetical protein
MRIKRKYTRRKPLQPKTETQPIEIELPAAEVMEEEQIETKDKGNIIDVIGIRLAKNENFIYANFQGERIAVFAGRRFAKRLVGKRFQVSITEGDSENQYHYHP